jgi:hypothetical protein
MKLKSLVLASCGVFTAISMLFAAQASAHIRATEWISYGDNLPSYVYAYCEPSNGCNSPNDAVLYEVSQVNDWNNILASLRWSNLNNGDRAFCSVVVECSDGSYQSDNQMSGATCNVSCPWGSHALTVIAEVGVQP